MRKPIVKQHLPRREGKRSITRLPLTEKERKVVLLVAGLFLLGMLVRWMRHRMA